jgi:hypothetical protein
LGEVDCGDAGRLGEDGEDDEVLLSEMNSMVVVVGWFGQWRRAIARPELAVPAGLRGKIRQCGREVEVGVGCGERGGRGDFIGGLGLGEGLGFRAVASIGRSRMNAFWRRTLAQG